MPVADVEAQQFERRTRRRERQEPRLSPPAVAVVVLAEGEGRAVARDEGSDAHDERAHGARDEFRVDRAMHTRSRAPNTHFRIVDAFIAVIRADVDRRRVPQRQRDAFFIARVHRRETRDARARAVRNDDF